MTNAASDLKGPQRTAKERNKDHKLGPETIVNHKKTAKNIALLCRFLWRVFLRNLAILTILFVLVFTIFAL